MLSEKEVRAVLFSIGHRRQKQPFDQCQYRYVKKLQNLASKTMTNWLKSGVPSIVWRRLHKTIRTKYHLHERKTDTVMSERVAYYNYIKHFMQGFCSYILTGSSDSVVAGSFPNISNK